MHYDIIIGNPPYQQKDGGYAASAKPIYQKFIQGAKALKPQYISYIIPARWYTGGKGLKEFRAEMLADKCISHLVDYPNSNDCFKDVAIEGGVCYFLWDRGHQGGTKVSNMVSGAEPVVAYRNLNDFDWFIRHNRAVSILQKVKAVEGAYLNEKVSSRTPFGMRTDFTAFTNTKSSDTLLKLYANSRYGYVEERWVSKFKDGIPKWKVLVSSAYGGGPLLPSKVLGSPIIAEPQAVCTETYVVLNHFDDELSAIRFAQYSRTRFFRFMVSLIKNTQHNSKEVFSFVPDLPMTEDWTDEQLYLRYGLDEEEIAFIETRVRGYGEKRTKVRKNGDGV